MSDESREVLLCVVVFPFNYLLYTAVYSCCVSFHFKIDLFAAPTSLH